MDENISSNIAPRSKWKLPVSVFFKDARLIFKMDSLAKEILGIAFPSALAVAADPIASLIDTAFIGHLGPVELAAAGVSIALFNQASRITIFPLVSITTSFVAEEDTIEKIKIKAAENQFNEDLEAPTETVAANVVTIDLMATKVVPENVERDSTLNIETNHGDDGNTNTTKSSSSDASSSNKSVPKSGRKKRHIASASTALLFGTVLGLLQVAVLVFAAKPLLGAMGLKPGSPMEMPAIKYLRLRALGAPAVLLSLAMQGIFRGFKDTTTPLYIIVAGYALNVALDPLLIFYFKLGINGAAISHVLSQRFVVSKSNSSDILCDLSNLISSKVWLTSSLLADGLAVAIQAILACSFAEKDYDKVTAAATRTLQMSFVLGVGLSLLVGVGLYFGAGIFSNSVPVVALIRLGVPDGNRNRTMEFSQR
ncbi:unnamed protein product [Lupinus luteus]|uniref:Protein DETOXIFICATION n=1 Tax=Lupinus luteus TaxID=3873 RepID=A0AAV1XYU8_LUPLU